MALILFPFFKAKRPLKNNASILLGFNNKISVINAIRGKVIHRIFTDLKDNRHYQNSLF